MTERVDKDSLPLDKPRRTPNHPTKSHIVKTMVGGKEKIIRFGEQGASTAGKPKAGESERMKMKRKSFKARHAKNIAKGKSSPAYWANKVKWADGGHVELKNMLNDYEDADDVTGIVQKFKSGGQPKKPKEPGMMDYLESVVNSVSSLPDLPSAIYQTGKRVVRAAPEVARSGLNYIRRSTPQEVARDVKGGLTAVARQVKENPVSTVLDFIPVVGDIKAYGEDIGRAARMRAQGDVAGARGVEQYALPLAAASILPGVGEVRKAGNVVDVVEEAAPAVRMMKKPAAFPVDFGRPKGNLNLRPSVDPVTLKGADVQDIESIINQLKGKPGVTKQGLETVARQFEPGESVSIAQFGERMPQSEYSLKDLAGDVDNADEHIWQEAMHVVNQDRGEVFGRVADDAGLNWHDGRFIQDIYDNGYDPLNLDHVQIAEYLASRNPGMTNIEDLIGEMYQSSYDDAVDMTAEQLRDYMEPGDYGTGYQYQDYQRLVPDIYKTDSGYFELGVTHPEMTDKYRHYPNAENLAGHIRGTFMGKNPRNLLSGLRPLRTYDDPVSIEDWLGGRGSKDHSFTPKPNSMVIEELQSDAAKNLGDTGALHQIHGTLFKGAIQHALEQGADTVYLPTSKAIGIARYTEPSAYAPIYDKEVIKYGLNPLREIPGIEINPIDDMYHEITISPEAKDYILKGRGQKAPGYAEGGSVDVDPENNFADGGFVSTFDEAKVADLANQIREGIYG